MTKGEFAGLIGVTPGRVSQMIAAGKIGRAALDGEGRKARIIVERALADLKLSLDVNQSLGANGLRTRLGGEDVPARATVDIPLSEDDRRRDALLAEKLRQAQLQTVKMQRDEQLQQGRYVIAEDLQRAVAETNARLIQSIEASLPGLADQIAAEIAGADRRMITHHLRVAFRRVRERLAAGIADEATTLPETIEDPLAAPIEGTA